MEKFTTVIGPAAPLLRQNVDTDTIIPMQRMLDNERDALGQFALEPLRFRADGSENPDFPLHQPAYRGAPILIAGRNFGCGSSRETAVWALQGMGIRVVIAPSFGDIFYNNCFKNGVLPIVLDEKTVEALAAASAAGPTTIDLAAGTIRPPNREAIAFEVPPAQREALLEGLDEIDVTRRRMEEIRTFQARDRAARPWIYDIVERGP